VNQVYFETRFRSPNSGLWWPSEFAIISAYATTGQTWGADENEAADQRLESELSSEMRWHTRIIGYSPRSGHTEPGWAVALPLQAARAKGADYRQHAIYHVKVDDLSVCPCQGASPHLVYIDSFLRRLDLTALSASLSG
jgi:hypothetical protein